MSLTVNSSRSLWGWSDSHNGFGQTQGVATPQNGHRLVRMPIEPQTSVTSSAVVDQVR